MKHTHLCEDAQNRQQPEVDLAQDLQVSQGHVTSLYEQGLESIDTTVSVVVSPSGSLDILHTARFTFRYHEYGVCMS